MANERGLAADQDAPEQLGLLAAKSRLYFEAERLWLIRIFIALALLVVGPIIVIIWPVLTNAVALVGIVFTLISEAVLARLETTKVREAALVQEQFDTSVFGLPWNENFVGRPVLPELVAEADRHYTGDRNALRDWYPDVSPLPRPLAVLVCQRCNAVWDARQRRRFTLSIGTATALVFVVGVLVGLQRGMSLEQYLFGIVSPSLAAYIQGARMAETHRDAATDKDAVESTITRLWERALAHVDRVTMNECRQVQDRIFALRLSGAITPAWLYQVLRPGLEQDMRAVAAQMVREAEGRLRT